MEGIVHHGDTEPLRTTGGVQVWLVLLVCWTMPPLLGQANPSLKIPKVLLQIMHCAETDNSGLGDASLKPDDTLKVAWSYAPNRGLDLGEEFFIVVYRTPNEGDIYVYTRGYERGNTVLFLRNNASFHGTAGNYQYVNDPLGGIWTQNHTRRNVNRALRSRVYSITVQAIARPYPELACQSYSDADRP